MAFEGDDSKARRLIFNFNDPGVAILIFIIIKNQQSDQTKKIELIAPTKNKQMYKNEIND